ncbi:MAG: SDR family oxidoreductase [Pseudomonadota bacterium]
MEVSGKTVVVTGAASGIGKELARQFHLCGASRVVCADIDFDGVTDVARELKAVPLHLDVGSEDAVRDAITQIEATIGPIDIFCSNAGVLTIGGLEVTTEDWTKAWNINVMSHVWAARYLVPGMIERSGGYLLNTVSAAGLLNQPGALAYATTKHAAIGVAEWLALTYGHKGIGVSVLCPQGVRTDMLAGFEDSVVSLNGILEPDDVARACIKAIENEEFLVLPHEQVLGYLRNKSQDYDRWIHGMQKLNQQFME